MEPVFAFGQAFDSPVAWIIMAAVVLILFGGGKLKDFGKSLGEGISELKKATTEPKPDDTMKSASDVGATATPGTKKES